MAGTISRGIKAPIIRQGDDIVKIVADSVIHLLRKNTGYRSAHNLIVVKEF